MVLMPILVGIETDAGNANLDMTFRVTKKVNNTNEHEYVRTCEKLRLNDRGMSSNQHEYVDIENYYVSDLGKYLISHIILLSTYPTLSITEKSTLENQVSRILQKNAPWSKVTLGGGIFL